MLFQVGFFVVCLDVYLHAPLSKDVRHFWYVTSLVALVADEAIGYYLSECLLLAVLCKEYYEEKRSAVKKKVVSEEEVRVVEEEISKIVPAQVKSVLVSSANLFEKNLTADDVTCDGKPWKLCAESKELKIFNADYPGLKIKRWKVVSEVVGSCHHCLSRATERLNSYDFLGYRDDVYAELFDFERRLKWDPALADGKQLAEYDADGAGEKVAITAITTASAGGGAVSSREMTDAGLLKYTDDGGLRYAQVSLGPEYRRQVPSLPKPRKDPIRAFTHPGK